jgi:rubredoxin
MKKDKKQTGAWWKCSLCGYTLQAAAPPEACPGCEQACSFTDVTCYTPECGGPGNLDPRLMNPEKK